MYTAPATVREPADTSSYPEEKSIHYYQSEKGKVQIVQFCMQLQRKTTTCIINFLGF